MSSVLVRRVAVYFLAGWLLGLTLLVGLEQHDRCERSSPVSTAGFYLPPLHPLTVALGQGLFSILGLALFARRREQRLVPLVQRTGDSRGS